MDVIVSVLGDMRGDGRRGSSPYLHTKTVVEFIVTSRFCCLDVLMIGKQ